MSDRDLVIGLDCGTSSAKALALDGEGRTLGAGRAPIALSNPGNARYEQDAEDWWRASASAIREAAGAAGPDRIRAISISVQRESFVPVDADGRPLRPALLWMDGRAGGLIPELEEKIAQDEFRAITGKALSGNLSLCKILWLLKNEPDLMERAALFLDAHAYLAQRMTGRPAASRGSADPTGLFDMRNGSWSERIAGMIGLGTERLPEALTPGAVLGELTVDAAEACGLPRGVILASGLGDGQAAGLGSGIIGPGESYLSLGTSIVTGSHAQAFIADKAFRTSYGGLPGSYFLETVILAGAQSLSWFMGALGGGGDEARRAEEAAGIEPGSDGMLFLPYLNAAMNPYWDSGASAVFAGLSSGHGRAHAYRAVLEGIAQELRLHTEGVEEALSKRTGERRRIERYVAAGGGAAHGLWPRIIADATGRSIVRSRTEEAAALGAGILAAGASGLRGGIEEAARAMAGRETEEIQPDPASHAAYDRYYRETYLRLYPALRDTLARLSALASRST